MKINFTFRVLALIMVILTLSIPPVTFAQQHLQSEAIIIAEGDAENDVSKGLWFLGGCFGGVVGLIVAYAVQPAPPATRLLGKSPEYVASYTDAYQERAKMVQTNNALLGCVVNGFATTLLIVAAAAAEASD